MRASGHKGDRGRICKPDGRGSHRVLTAIGLALLSGCASLPSNGPTASRIESVAQSSANQLGFSVVAIAPDTLPAPRPESQVAAQRLTALAAATPRERSDIIRRGDTLSVAIYEVGISLFGPPAPQAGASPGTPTATGQQISVQVDEDGRIALPYVGRLEVAGLTPELLSGILQARLKPYSQSPQVSIAIAESLANSAYVSGAVAQPGRYRLPPVPQRLLDIVTLAGGASVPSDEAELRLARGTSVATIRLGDLKPEDAGNIRVVPGDRIEILRRPRSFTVFGAADKAAQVPFETSELSLAEAIARAGGPSDARANASGIFLFRYEQAPVADDPATPAEPRPVIYRLNMLDPASYFLAQRIAMHDKDVIVFANAAGNIPSKFISLLNQLFSPVVTARVLTQ